MPRPSKEARLYPRKREGRAPVWVILDGKSEISTGCTLEDVDGARKALRDHLERTFKPDTSERDLSQIPVAEVLMFYLSGFDDASPSLATKTFHVKALNGFWGEKTLDDVKGSTCRDYVKARPVKASTARQELKTLQAAVNFWNAETPLPKVITVTLPKAAPPRDRVLERGEVARLLIEARKRRQPHVARFILIGLYTGTRHQAILKLKWGRNPHGGHVDLTRGLIYRIGHAEQRTTKTRPPVRITPRLAGHLRRWQRADAVTQARDVIHYKGASVAKMRRAFNTIVRAAGLGWTETSTAGKKLWKTDITPHTLRHTCASWRLWDGETIWDVAGVLGADASTVDKVYGHHQVERERKRA